MANRRCKRTVRHGYCGGKAVLGSGSPRAQRSEAGKAHQIKNKKLGSGKPYDKRSKKEAALNVPVVVGWRGGGGTDQG